jgi:hypothetical protein
MECGIAASARRGEYENTPARVVCWRDAIRSAQGAAWYLYTLMNAGPSWKGWWRAHPHLVSSTQLYVNLPHPSEG